jgi:AraC-like DNA-binding protein
MDAGPVGSTLAHHTLVDTRLPEEARQEIGRIFCPHFLSPSDRRAEGFHAVHRSARQAGYSLNFVSYGAEVEIDPGELGSFFLLQMPLTGSAAVRCGTEAVEAVAGCTASVLSPTLPTRMRWLAGCQKLIVLIDRDMMQRQCEALTGRGVGAVEFATGIDSTMPAGRLMASHVRLMLEAIDAEAAVPAAYLRGLGESLASLMLTSLRHSQDVASSSPAVPADSRAVGRAEAWMRANSGRSFSVAEVAEAAGTSLRSLQNAIKRDRGMTLGQAVQDIRLLQFRQALTDPHERGGVTDLAYAAGLGHAGRAAAAYRRRYGETPGETLRRKR